jgi:two-component system LytT family response regulator
MDTYSNIPNQPVAAGPASRKIAFPYKGGIHFFSIDQIIRLEADSNYTYIYTTLHKPILMAKVMCAYEDLLRPLGFIRTHRSHLINTKHIASVQGYEIIMDDMSKPGISRRKRKEVFQSLKYSIHAA